MATYQANDDGHADGPSIKPSSHTLLPTAATAWPSGRARNPADRRVSPRFLMTLTCNSIDRSFHAQGLD